MLVCEYMGTLDVLQDYKGPLAYMQIMSTICTDRFSPSGLVYDAMIFTTTHWLTA